MAVLGGRPADHLPRVPILMQFAAEYIGSNYGAFASDHRVLVESNLRCARDFGMDQVSAISDPYRETQGFGAQIEFVRDGVPRCLRLPLEDSKDLSSLPRPHPLTAERMRDRIEAIRLFQKHAADYSILGWVEGPAAEAADLRGVTTFLLDLIDDEPFAAALMDRCLQTAVDFSLAQLAAGADTIGIGDAIASQVSSELYESLILPREKQLVDAIHKAGGLARLHICGNITHLLPGIATLNVDILDVDHMVDLTVARQAVGPQVVLAGNLDPAAVIRFGTPEGIRAALASAYAAAGDPYLVNAGCEIPPGTPPANLRALCEPMPFHSPR